MPAAAGNWPAFRGVNANGVSTADAPVIWNADASAGEPRNILWKTPLPGLSHSSPILWDERLYVMTAVSMAGEAPLKVGLYGAGDSAEDKGEQAWKIYALDRRTGEITWEQTAYQGAPRALRHTKATHANTTISTDGKRLIAFFGSEGLYAYSMDGKLLWKKDLGVLVNTPSGWDLQWGYASSPALYRNTIVVLCDVKSGAFLAALSAEDGRELWRTPRTGVSSQSWSTPAVIEHKKRAQVVANGWPYIASYDFATGKELWRLKSEGDIPVPTPIFAHGLIYVTNAHGGGAPLYAIKPDAEGDISLAGTSRTSAGVVWSEAKNGAYMQTPLVLGDLIYSCSDRGILKVYDARTGKRNYEQRLGAGTTGFSSSPVAAGGRLYFASEEGEVYVLKAGPVFELLATNKMGEITMATPAADNGVLYYRTRGHVVAIGEK
jgi:outer membrane protein assembly factor BamB